MWLDWVKFEEERGHWHKAIRIILSALSATDSFDQLIIRGIKVAERMGDPAAVRNLLSKTRPLSLEKAWKALSEVCLRNPALFSGYCNAFGPFLIV